MRVVLDTGILIAALSTSATPPDAIYQASRNTSTFYLFGDGESQPLFGSTPHPLYAGNLSRDGKWFVFKGDLDDQHTQVYVTPFDAAKLPIDVNEPKNSASPALGKRGFSKSCVDQLIRSVVEAILTSSVSGSG